MSRVTHATTGVKVLRRGHLRRKGFIMLANRYDPNFKERMLMRPTIIRDRIFVLKAVGRFKQYSSRLSALFARDSNKDLSA